MHRAEQKGRGVSPLTTSPAAPPARRPADRAQWSRTGGNEQPTNSAAAPPKVPEVGGPKGPEPTRYGDWERNGICYDF